jgi:putative SOS response-associated peptidase YedK
VIPTSKPFLPPLEEYVGYLAGIWERWKSKDGEPLYSCAIVTTAASAIVAPVHDRMPAILAPEMRNAWLDPQSDPVRLSDLLAPYAESDLEKYAVSTRVNAVVNDSPDLIEPADPVDGGQTK